MTTLASMAPGTTCRVAAVDGVDSIAQRLMEMGLVPGCTLEFVRRAPLGDPIQVTLLGYHLSLRRTEAARIEVEP